MAVEKIDIHQFLALAQSAPVLDARSPGEYNHAHIPGAISLPLFSDEERKVVGTAYKQEGRQQAIKIGLDYFGPKMRQMVETVEGIAAQFSIQNHPDKTVLVHCWRGGMRSGAIAWLLDLYGFKVYSLAGGYKQFRNFIIGQFEQEYNFQLVGGYTGSGKTYVLHELSKKNAVTIDLEKLASHKGSAFGAFGQPPQPTQEMFENLLGLELQKAKALSELQSPSNFAPIWLEDESQRIGTINIPQAIWVQMRNSQVFFLDIPFEERLTHIVNEYGRADIERMVNAIIRIKKRLGGLETKTAINALIEGDLQTGFAVLLKYYDRYYLKGLHNRENVESLLTTIELPHVDPLNSSKLLLGAQKQFT